MQTRNIRTCRHADMQTCRHETSGHADMKTCRHGQTHPVTVRTRTDTSGYSQNTDRHIPTPLMTKTVTVNRDSSHNLVSVRSLYISDVSVSQWCQRGVDFVSFRYFSETQTLLAVFLSVFCQISKPVYTTVLDNFSHF